MTSSNDTDLFDTISLIETDASSDFELVDFEHDERTPAPSSIASDVASSVSDADSLPPSPDLQASRFHFPDPVSVFDDQDLNDVDSHSLYTPMAQSRQSDEFSSPQADLETPRIEHSEYNEHISTFPLDFNHVEKAASPFLPKGEQTSPSKLRRGINAFSPKNKAAWLVAVLATALVGFKSSSILGFTHRASSLQAMQAGHLEWSTKIAAPAVSSNVVSLDASTLATSAPPSASLALAPKPSPSSLALTDTHSPERPLRRKQGIKGTDNGPIPVKPPSLSLQAAASTDLSVVAQSSAGPSTASAARRSVRASNASLRRSKHSRYANLANQKIFQLGPDLPVLPLKPNSSYLDNATTTTWAFWLAELQTYEQLVLRPAILAVKQHAYEAGRLARRYHKEQVLPAFATLREHAVYTAQRTAEFTAQYNEEQVRPAFVFVRDQAAQTAQRTAEYREKVVVPALAQLRQQAREAAKTTSHGLNKAAKRFSSDAAEAVQQVKEATQINLEALGVDEYVGFMMHTFKTMSDNLRTPPSTGKTK
ncbi:hypothetical protein NDA16_003978 [Ustilago loliicola]|nr:hypothetical protein NDA16_003978 [Ustilago loliicola]